MNGLNGVFPGFLFVLIPSLLAGAVQMVCLRIRETRAPAPDPHLGRKSLLYLIFNVAIFLILLGLIISSLDVTEYLFKPAVAAQQARLNAAQSVPSPPVVTPVGAPAPAPPVAPVEPEPPDPLPPTIIPPVPPPPAYEWFNEQQRHAAGLVVSGLSYAVLIGIVLRFATNDKQFPAVRRAFAGTRFGIIALAVMMVSTASVLMFFQKGETDYGEFQKTIAVLAVLVPAGLIHAILVFWTSGWRRRSRKAAANPTS